MAYWDTHGTQPNCCPFCGQELTWDLDHCLGASHYEEADNLYRCAVIEGYDE